MKGIILAGGKGTRLYPLTMGVSKQLLPVYNKPMIYYPLSMMMLAGIRKILIITTPTDNDQYKRLLSDGSQWGLSFEYAIQDEPRGLADAFIIGKEFIGEDNVALILGDNIFYGTGLQDVLRNAAKLEEGAIIFAYRVTTPERYGVVEFNEQGRVLSIEEKPKNPRTNYAVPGIYFYDNQVTQYADQLKPSDRGEIEITEINQKYMAGGNLRVKVLGRGIAWLDAGLHSSLLQASNFVQAVEERQGMMISCPEEIAYRMGFIAKQELIKLAEAYNNNDYGKYLLRLAKES